MTISSLRGLAAAGLASFALAGCVEQHLAQRDTISPYAGSAVTYNKMVHVIDPAPRYRYAGAPASGARIESTMQRYRAGLTPGPSRGGASEAPAIPIVPALAPAPAR